MDPERHLHVVHLLIRNQSTGAVCFLVYPHDKWKSVDGQPFWTLPTKKTVIEGDDAAPGGEPFARFQPGTSVETFVEDVMETDFHLRPKEYALEQEIDAVYAKLPSPSTGALTLYTTYPVDVWVDPAQRECLRARVQGEWLTCEAAVARPDLSPTAAQVFRLIRQREAELDEKYRKEPAEERLPHAPQRLLRRVSDEASMDAMARKWFHHNRGGVRHLRKQELDDILRLGNRAFNLRVADPYLGYQLQGVGFTWSFFTDKDTQDLHVHGAPVVEIYGVLEGRLEVWWKPYYDRGTSAWSHKVLETGDWLEMDSLQCHIVRWLGPGKGVVFKAGPGPLAEVGRLGVKGKTPCDEKCHCIKPPKVLELIAALAQKKAGK